MSLFYKRPRLLLGLFFALSLIFVLFFKRKERYDSRAKVQIPPISYSRLSLHFFSSPHGVDWTSPKSLLWSVLKNELSSLNRRIGHVAQEIQCVGPEGETAFYTFTGMVDRGMDPYKLLVQKGLGFGIISHIHKGRLEETPSLQQELKSKRESGRVQTLTFKISEESCLNLREYLKAYQEEGLNQFYGGLNYRVRYKEPGGCVHFSQSLVDIANLEGHSFLDDWKREIFIPKELIGSSRRKVGLFRLMTSDKMKAWAINAQDGERIEFWDIDSIFSKIKNAKSSEFLINHYEKGSQEIILDLEDQDFEKKYWLKN